MEQEVVSAARFQPIYDDGTVRLYVGDCREVVPALQLRADLLVCDPPYGSTSLAWDRWSDGWLETAALASSSLWCFGTLRMFMDRAAEFAGWRHSHDVVWEKHNGSAFHRDRFRRVHESIAHFYRGPWTSVYRDVQTTNTARQRVVRTKGRPPAMGQLHRRPYSVHEGGPKLVTSVFRVRGSHGRAIAPTQKPNDVLAPLIRYGCPKPGTVGDLFAGSASTLIVARALGLNAWGIEADPAQAERAARALAQMNAFDKPIGGRDSVRPPSHHPNETEMIP